MKSSFNSFPTAAARVEGEQTPAFGRMLRSNAAGTMVRESRIHQPDNVLRTSVGEEMISTDKSIQHLRKAGRISRKLTLRAAVPPDRLFKRKTG